MRDNALVNVILVTPKHAYDELMEIHPLCVLCLILMLQPLWELTQSINTNRQMAFTFPQAVK